ncbi:CHASE4 domain-containing protein [uncultured Methanoregula sp.]|uniref:CHASE4 domain-containing protein n=1 Tax=uncultured Methanoregula sp. TaxID=1005933 RepID=UPI002AAB70E8|nr:CHASE4 domain-containing protein [uncultured Methanoregula sp.]
MSVDIREKTIVIVCITLLCLILALYTSSELIVQKGFSRLELQSAQRDTDRVLVALVSDINTLDAVANDWASRDDTRQYIADNSSTGQWSQLEDDIFEWLGLNDILLSDAGGNLISGQGYDLTNHTFVSVPSDLRTVLFAYPRSGYAGRSREGMMGIVQLPNGPMMIAIRPVFGKPGSQDVTGYLLMGKYIDTNEVARLSTLTQLPLEVHLYNDPSMPPDFVRIVPRFNVSSALFIQREGNEALFFNAPTIIEPVNDTMLGTYSLIRDISGNPVVILRVSISRDIYAQGKSTGLYFVILFIASGLIFGLVMLMLLEKTVLSRLAELSQRVNNIGKKRDFSARVGISGADEIGDLAGNVNGMLEDLEQSQNVLHNRLIQSEEQYRLFFNSIKDPVCICRMAPDKTLGRIVEINNAACEVLGYERTEFLEMDLSDLFIAEIEEGVSLPVEELRASGHVISAGVCKTQSDRQIPVEITARSFDQFGSPAIVAIIRDISERIEIEHLKKEAFGQIESNLQQYAILNDHIRNPLQGIIGVADMMEDPLAEKIIMYSRMIDEIVNKLDRGYIESEKIHRVLRKYYDIGKKE